ncbi:hypothetical protein L1987_89264 [Smallanthus sonchifolius]|nr:hypothetical protein L1987_89264 [Smallanthus sonchifolius]
MLHHVEWRVHRLSPRWFSASSRKGRHQVKDFPLKLRPTRGNSIADSLPSTVRGLRQVLMPARKTFTEGGIGIINSTSAVPGAAERDALAVEAKKGIEVRLA